MPYVEGSESAARCLAQDIDAGSAIRPGHGCRGSRTERIVGLYRAVADDSAGGGWRLDFETLTASAEGHATTDGTHLAWESCCRSTCRRARC